MLEFIIKDFKSLTLSWTDAGLERILHLTSLIFSLPFSSLFLFLESYARIWSDFLQGPMEYQEEKEKEAELKAAGKTGATWQWA
jgi:hypothetical protein